jgi:phosphoenolpyruvate carboxykinase (GTP)
VEKSIELINSKCDSSNFNKLVEIKNIYLFDFISKFIKLLNPESIFVCNDSPEDIQYIRDRAIKTGEEEKLTIKGHTVHFDGINDQARDKKKTKFLVPKNINFGKGLNTIDKNEGLDEIYEIMNNIMNGRELFISFFSLGPNNSKFSIPAVQLTDSSYVAHSESILYRPGYIGFTKLGNYKKFFKFVHSEGELEKSVSVNIDKRRIYIDTEEDIVYSANTQYGGNTIGLKKLAMRLGINRASKEGWLTEHMFLSGIHGPNGRVTYFAGAFPSMCGKTSTAMITGETIIGDDIVYIRNINGRAHIVNVEIGVFGIIKDINPEDDQLIWTAINNPKEIIFSNVLVTEEKNIYWIGKPGEVPKKGINYAGLWEPGKRDSSGNEITPSHKNARFTINLKNFSNIDPEYDNPEGVQIGGIIYGGRDSDTWVPVQEAYDWVHGIVTMGASIESETTAATLGKTGVRTFNPMSNLDFLSIPIGKYIDVNIKFGQELEKQPKVFGVNYFLKGSDGKFLNKKADKRAWLKWMELRVNNDVGAIDIETGFIPKYDDLRDIFNDIFNSEYALEDYNKQFTLRIPENISKIDRILKIYKNLGEETPEILFTMLSKQKEKLQVLRDKKGDYITPRSF